MRISSKTFKQRFRRSAFRRLLRAETGLAAVEFALVLPIMLTLWIGGVEVTQGLSVDRRLNNLASAVGDLVARSKVVTPNDIDDIFDIDEGALYPFSTSGLSMRVTAIDIDKNKKAKVVWSRGQGSKGARPENQDLTSEIDAKLRIPETQIIMAEVYYTYTPALGYVITGNVPLDDRVYFTPRLTQYIKLCDNDGESNCKS